METGFKTSKSTEEKEGERANQLGNQLGQTKRSMKKNQRPGDEGRGKVVKDDGTDPGRDGKDRRKKHHKRCE